MATPKKTAPSYRCTECGWTAVKWVGRCGECQQWGTVVEVGVAAGPRTKASAIATPARPIGDVPSSESARHPTRVAEFDRVLGGGLGMQARNVGSVGAVVAAPTDGSWFGA